MRQLLRCYSRSKSSHELLPEVREEGRFFFFLLGKGGYSREIPLCGCFYIVTSKKMIAVEAIELYKSRDASEKRFRCAKSYLVILGLSWQDSYNIRTKIRFG